MSQTNEPGKIAIDEPVQSHQASPVKPKTDPRTKPKRQPPYSVVLYNDPDHTRVYVVEALSRICGHSRFKAWLLMRQAHYTGRARVWTGAFEHAEFKRERLREYGPDLYGAQPVNYPLKCELEPLPQ